MLEKFLKDNYDIVPTDTISTHCSAVGTVLELIAAAKKANHEEQIIEQLEYFSMTDKAQICVYLGGILNGYKKHGQA